MGKDGCNGYESDEKVCIKIGEIDDDHSKIDYYRDGPDEEYQSIHISLNKTGEFETYGYVNGEESRTSEKCYLTTACMKHYLENFDDKCHELTVLRWFRDHFVSENDIEQYYHIAPVIVRAIEADKHHNNIYDYIYESVVEYCVNAIEKGDYTSAYVRYKSSILNLGKTFVQ